MMPRLHDIPPYLRRPRSMREYICPTPSVAEKTILAVMFLALGVMLAIVAEIGYSVSHQNVFTHQYSEVIINGTTMALTKFCLEEKVACNNL